MYERTNSTKESLTLATYFHARRRISMNEKAMSLLSDKVINSSICLLYVKSFFILWVMSERDVWLTLLSYVTCWPTDIKDHKMQFSGIPSQDDEFELISNWPWLHCVWKKCQHIITPFKCLKSKHPIMTPYEGKGRCLRFLVNPCFLKVVLHCTLLVLVRWVTYYSTHWDQRTLLNLTWAVIFGASSRPLCDTASSCAI